MSVAEAVIGASDHYARAELVTLAVEDAVPVFLDRRRVELIDKDLPSAPYHHEALELDIGAAIDLVNRVRRSVAEHASAAISTMLATYHAQVLILPTSPYDSLPDSLEEVLSSPPLTHAADGMLYRESLAEAATELGMEVRRYPRKTDPTVLAAEAMGVDVARGHLGHRPVRPRGGNARTTARTTRWLQRLALRARASDSSLRVAVR